MDDNINYNKSSNNKKVIIIILCLIVIVCLGVFIYFKFIKTAKNETTNEQNIIENSKNNNMADNNGNSEITNTDIDYKEKATFLMTIEDVFSITGRGTVVTGRIEKGTINVNDSVKIIGLNGETRTTTVVGIETLRENLDSATVGDNVGLLLKNIKKDEVESGQVLAK